MTIGEMIKETVDALPVSKQRKALALVRKLGASPPTKRGPRRGSRKQASAQYIAKDAAVRGIAGMWKDRTDLPRDPVLAVKALRARMTSRGRNG